MCSADKSPRPSGSLSTCSNQLPAISVIHRSLARAREVRLIEFALIQAHVEKSAIEQIVLELLTAGPGLRADRVQVISSWPFSRRSGRIEGGRLSTYTAVHLCTDRP